MCTAIHYQNGGSYFGRTLDLEYHYQEEVVVTPRQFPFAFRNGKTLQNHYAIIGMATVAENYPLYYDAANECGLAVAGLNFPGNARYFPPNPQKDNITPFELIPWVLGQCKDLAQAKALLENINLWDMPFSQEWPNSPLHWLIADKTGAITVESVADGLKIYENPVGVLTNNPPFDYHLTNLQNYMNVTPQEPENRSGIPDLSPYSKGMGALGLPGDLSSASRFVRAVFTKANSVAGEGESESIAQFFHILETVSQTRGCCRLPDGKYEITQYTSCVHLNRGIYYYTTYENRTICGVGLHNCPLNTGKLYQFPLKTSPQMII